MDQPLFSSTLTHYTKEITNNDLNISLNTLASYYPERILILLDWGDGRLAIPLKIPVDLPPLGNAAGVDIREVENIVIVIDPAKYPSQAPRVFTDRLDFPKDQLAHLYVAKGGQPPGFCLTRQDISEWYADKQLKDVVIKTSNWLRDAAAGTLTGDGNQFDPVRLENYNGSLIYDYDKLAAIVQSKKSLFADGNFTLAQFERITVEEDYLSWRFIDPITADKVEEWFYTIMKEVMKENKTESKRYLYFGYILWSDNNLAFSDYNVHLPENWEGFKRFCNDHGIETKAFESSIAKDDLNAYPSVPIIVAVRRPFSVIGFCTNIEFFNFHLFRKEEDIDNGLILGHAIVKSKQHKQPLTCEKAKDISGFFPSFEALSLVAGCGALGSKIVLHLAKSGGSMFILADEDRLSPHNFVRHGLSARNVNENKAVALALEINLIFSGEPIAALAIKTQGELLLELAKDKKVMEWIFDFTASTVFFHNLVKSIVHPSTKISKAYITDFGNLGVLLFEGKNRNPRLDDLESIMYVNALKDEVIYKWLKREFKVKNKATSVMVGIGCNSETTILSDDIVSLHAALFSSVIKDETKQLERKTGKIFLNRVIRKPFFHNQVIPIECLSLDVYKAINDSNWEVRFAPGIIKELQKQMKSFNPYETGGVLVGSANHKTRTIHVMSVIDAPPDSRSSSIYFYRGEEGLLTAIEHITERTGGQLGYIGEWHSHPKGPEAMSDTDHESVLKFKKEFQLMPTPLPVFLLIITLKEY